jgi:hypothetical protein
MAVIYIRKMKMSLLAAAQRLAVSQAVTGSLCASTQPLTADRL